MIVFNFTDELVKFVNFLKYFSFYEIFRFELTTLMKINLLQGNFFRKWVKMGNS